MNVKRCYWGVAIGFFILTYLYVYTRYPFLGSIKRPYSADSNTSATHNESVSTNYATTESPQRPQKSIVKATETLQSVRANFSQNIDVKHLGVLMLQLADVRRAVESDKSLLDNVNLFEDLQKTEQLVYPFLTSKHKTFDEWRASYSGRGVVTTGAPHHMRYVVFLIKNLKDLNCTLPVQFVSDSVNALSDKDKGRLTELGVEILYLTDIIDPKVAQFDGFAMKLAAMFVSSFREAIFLDMDDVFIKNPELLYDDIDYKTTGTLFYPDQPEKNDGFAHRDWLIANLPHPLSQRVLKSEMFKGFQRAVDSAAIVMDKVRNFIGLLAGVRLNMPRERGQLYPVFGGDAELWWIGFEMVNVSYAISPFPSGAIGPANGDEVCGRNMHVGRDERPFFWNQGVVKRKGIRSEELVEMNAYIKRGIVVIFPSHYCVKGTGAVPLNKEELTMVARVKEIWMDTKGFNDW